MNEENVTTQNEVDNTMCCAMEPLPASKMAMELRLMMDRVDGEDKCTLCKAAEELEKTTLNQSNSWDSMWFYCIMLLIFSGFGDKQTIDPDALSAYMDVIKKKSQESDCKLQNEN